MGSSPQLGRGRQGDWWTRPRITSSSILSRTARTRLSEAECKVRLLQRPHSIHRGRKYLTKSFPIGYERVRVPQSVMHPAPVQPSIPELTLKPYVRMMRAFLGEWKQMECKIFFWFYLKIGNSHLKESEICIKPNWQCSAVFWARDNIFQGCLQRKGVKRWFIF